MSVRVGGFVFAVICPSLFCVVDMSVNMAGLRICSGPPGGAKSADSFSCFLGSGKRRRVTDERVLRLPLEFG